MALPDSICVPCRVRCVGRVLVRRRGRGYLAAAALRLLLRHTGVDGAGAPKLRPGAERKRSGADARNRTADPFITSEVLCQLSYVGSGEALAF